MDSGIIHITTGKCINAELYYQKSVKQASCELIQFVIVEQIYSFL